MTNPLQKLKDALQNMLTDMEDSLRKTLNAVNKSLQDLLAVVQKGVNDGLKAVENALTSVTNTAAGLDGELATMRAEAQKARAEMAGCANAVKELTSLLKDTESLHRKILEFLESDLFRRAA